MSVIVEEVATLAAWDQALTALVQLRGAELKRYGYLLCGDRGEGDRRLREDLAAVAGDAGPLGLSLESLLAKVKRRRRRSAVGAVAGTAAVVIGIVAAAGWLGASPRGGLTPATSPSYPRPFVCGEELALGPGAAATQAGLTMTLSKARKVGESTGPDLEVTSTADRPLRVQGSPPYLFEMLYVRDGVIVGGGPMLNQPGDMTGQAMSLIGSGFDVGPGRPITVDLGRRDKLCPGLTWPQVWSAPQRYEVVLVQGRVLPRPEVRPDHVVLDIPTLGYWPLIVARARLEA